MWMTCRFFLTARSGRGLGGRRLVYKMRHVVEFVDFFATFCLCMLAVGRAPHKAHNVYYV